MMHDRFNPLLGEEEGARLAAPLYRPAPPRPGEALVVHRSGRPLAVVWPDRPSATPISFWNAVVYRVDVGKHLLTFKFQVPSSGGGYDFVVDIAMNCTVTDPAVIVRDKLRDPYATIERLLESTTRVVGHRYGDEQAAEVEREIKSAIGLAIDHGEYGEGLTFDSLAVKASLARERREYLKKVIRTHDSHSLEDLLDSHLLDRVTRYRPLVAGGQWELLALRLIKSPGDVDPVLRFLADSGAAERADRWEAIKYLLEQDEVDSRLDPAVRALLERFVDELGPEWSPRALPASSDPDPGRPRLRGRLSRPPSTPPSG